MTRSFLITIYCLLFSITGIADETPMSAHELAETKLLAEWVGSPDKQFELGTAYYKGNGVPRDYAEAVKWYRLAADQGQAKSRFMLGVIHERGQGMSPDYFEAVKWYRAAAEQGYIPAQYELGNKYAAGKGVPQNYAQAYVWFSIAAASGHEGARKARDKFARKLSAEEIMEAQARATQIFDKLQLGDTAD